MTDAQVRERATDPTRSILLSAPAGSGKTSVLTERLLRLLAIVPSPERILAITFTRKAAVEMRERVMRALRGELAGDQPQTSRLRELSAAVQARAREAGWNLVESPHLLRIQTIDSLNFALAAQLPVTARAVGALVVSDDAREIYRRAARTTLLDAQIDPALAADVDLLFERLDNQWRNVESLVATMLGTRAHWLRHVLDDDEGALRRRIEAGIEAVMGARVARVHALLPADLLVDLAGLPDVGEITSDARSLEAWQRFAKCVLTARECAWRKRLSHTEHASYRDAAVKAHVEAVIAKLSRVHGLREQLASFLDVPPLRLAAEDRAALAALSRVLQRAAAELHLAFAAAGRVDHSFIASAAREALTESGEPTDIALRTGLAIDHILVDEFQDTSLGQLELLSVLTAEWDEGDGRTLFVVGDPMQSIYQFREAEVGLFLQARDRGIGRIRLEPLRLTRNFRSRPELVRWTNETFGSLFPRRDDLRESGVAHTASVAARDSAASAEPVVELSMLDAESPGLEARAIVERVRALRAHDTERSIAVLVFARTHAVPITAALLAAGIPVRGVKLVPLVSLPVVSDLAALVRALHRLADRSAWLAVLRAPWCGASLATLTALSSRNDPQLLVEAARDPTRLAACAPDDLPRLSRVMAILQAAFDERRREPLADWIETTWIRLGGHECYDEDALTHARAFFAALAKRDAEGEWRGADDLDVMLADLHADPKGQPAHAVQIMTIHHAKGLEFDHVILPSLHKKVRSDRAPLLRWLDLPRADGSHDLLMSPIRAVGREQEDALGRFIGKLAAVRLRNERLRLLYVAATRARESLHVYAAARTDDGRVKPPSGSALALLWPATAEQFELADTSSFATSPTAPRRPGLRRLPADWGPAMIANVPLSPGLPIGSDHAIVPEFSWVGETARLIGSVVHLFLDRWSKSAAVPRIESVMESREPYRAALARLGVDALELDRAAELVQRALAATLRDERGQWMFAASHRDAASELALSGLHDGRLVHAVIDRSFVDADGTRWIIDYKTSRHEGGGIDAFVDAEVDRYRAQLARYAALAAALGPEPIRTALYFPLLGVFRECVI